MTNKQKLIAFFEDTSFDFDYDGEIASKTENTGIWIDLDNSAVEFIFDKDEKLINIETYSKSE